MPRLQMSIMGKVMLPGDQKLGEIIGGPLFDRTTRSRRRADAGEGAPPGTASMLMAKLLARMKPWAAMTQLSLLEFLPDIDGRPQAARHAMLW